jgi:hypothetical protein
VEELVGEVFSGGERDFGSLRRNGGGRLPGEVFRSGLARCVGQRVGMGSGWRGGRSGKGGRGLKVLLTPSRCQRQDGRSGSRGCRGRRSVGSKRGIEL